MKSFLKNKKVVIGIAFVLILAILIVGSIFLLKENKDDTKDNKPEETTSNYVAYIKINPLIKLEYSQTCNIKNCSDPIVTKYELINNDAKSIYKDIDLIGTNHKLYDVLNLISKTAEDNNIEFEKVEIYSNWENLNNYIDNSNKDEYKWSYIINIRDKENLEDISSSLENNKILYNVEFDTEGGTKINTQTIEKGTLVKQPTTPSKKGYIFVEWQLNGKKFDFNTEITSDITLKAKWKEESSANNNSQNNTEKKYYLNIGDFYSLERVKELEKEYDIKITLIADAKCAYLEGGNDQLVVAGKNYTAHISSLDPYIMGGCGDDSGIEDEPNYCEEDFNSEECIDSLLEFRDNKLMYDNKFLWSTKGVGLKRCYAYNCVNGLAVTIYSFDKDNINSIPSTHKKFIYDHYLLIYNSVSTAQSDYDNVVQRNYVQFYGNFVKNLENLLNRYEEYKNQGLIQNDDSIIPENLMECNLEGFGCFSSITQVKDEIEWQTNFLEQAKSDLEYASQALNSAKELYSLFN